MLNDYVSAPYWHYFPSFAITITSSSKLLAKSALIFLGCQPNSRLNSALDRELFVH
jgi:hypothetical protein